MNVEDVEKTKEYKKIKRSLMKQIKNMGCDTPHFISLAEDYMHMYAVKEIAIQDVKDRGNIIHYIGSNGGKMTKKNDSTEQIIKMNTQMIKILDLLGIKPGNGVVADEEEL